MRLIAPIAIGLVLAGVYVFAEAIGETLAPGSGLGGHIGIGAGVLSWFNAAWLATRGLETALTTVSRARRREVPKMLADVGGVVLFVAAVIGVTAFVFDRPVTGLVATSGVLVGVIGFALQNMISDLFSGLALNFEHPFEIGDWIEIDAGEAGEVRQINWRATHIVTIDGQTVTIPNGVLAGRKFINYNRPQRAFRTHKTVVLDYSVPPDRAVDVMTAAIGATEGVLEDPPPIILIGECSERGVKYLLHYWVAEYAPHFVIARGVVTNALNYLNQAGLAPAYPRRDVTLFEADARQMRRGFDVVALLCRVEMFGALEAPMLDDLAAAAAVTEFDADSVVVAEGEAGESLFVVVAGRLGVGRRGDDGEARRIGRLAPGDVFGEMSLVTGAPRSATVTALTPVTLIEVQKAHLRPVLTSSPHVADTLSRIQAAHHEAGRLTLELEPAEAE